MAGGDTTTHNIAPGEGDSDVGNVLVTGATGFLGGRLAQHLLTAGRSVRCTGRNLDAGLKLAEKGADFRPVDLREAAATRKVCEGVRDVVHCAAMSTAWGRWRDFYAANVEGTANLIAGCLAHGVRRLVYISSPSVMSRMEPQFGLTEADPLPDTFVSMYSETKKLGEDLVRRARDQGLETVILRPKAIYGPGDNAIFPRLIAAAARGRLPILGDGETITNLTHVDDVVQAILASLTSADAVGNTYVITGGEDSRIWDIIRTVVTRLGHAAPSKRISLRKALMLAGIMETVWRILRLPGEPLLTRYKVGTLAISQTYDISAARRDLGYEPAVPVEAGVEDFLRTLEAEEPAREETPPPPPGERTPTRVTVFNAGSCSAPAKLFYGQGSWRRIDVPAMCAVLEHPEQGLVVFDTGYSPRFFEATRRFPHRLMSWVTPVTCGPEDALVSQMRANDMDPESVRWVLLSHFDPDHYGGLKDFPNARIVCSRAAWSSVAGKTGLAALRLRLLPGHLPEDMPARVLILPDFDGPPVKEFPASLDLFGDQSVVLVDIPGHAAGQYGAFVVQPDGVEYFLAADACWNLASLNVSRGCGGVHPRLAVDKAGQRETYTVIRRLREANPALVIVPTHCPAAWDTVRKTQAERSTQS